MALVPVDAAPSWAQRALGKAVMHKFHLGQTVEYRSRNAPPGACVVTAKLPERDGEYEYRIRNLAEAHERMARESQLEVLSQTEAPPVENRSGRKPK